MGIVGHVALKQSAQLVELDEPETSVTEVLENLMVHTVGFELKCHGLVHQMGPRTLEARDAITGLDQFLADIQSAVSDLGALVPDGDVSLSTVDKPSRLTMAG